MPRLVLSIVLSLAALVSQSTIHADSWPQFRGPNADGLVSEASAAKLPTTWAKDSNISWQVNVPGEGWSAPVIANGKMIVSTAVSDGEKNKETNHRWEVHCFDPATGETLWSKVAKEGMPSIGTHRDNTYASETPVTDGERIVVYFGMTGLFCYDFEGNLLWQKDLGSYEMRNDWGTSSSPAMHEGMVYVQVDNEADSFLVALDSTNGEEKWRVARDENSNWGSAIIWSNSQRSELVTVGRTIRSYNPTNGDLLWQLATDLGSISSSPSAAGDLLLVGAAGRRGQGGGLWAISAGASGELTDDGNEGLAWTNEKAGPGMSSPLVYKGHAYILGRRGIVKCLDVTTGETVYEKRLEDSGAFWASPWAYGGKVYLPDADGTTHVLKAGPEFEVVGTNKLDGRFWASSAIADGRVFLRSTDTLFCVGADE